MYRLYGEFVKPGDLVFNVGANVGIRTRVFVDLGAQVVAVEPQPYLANWLRAYWNHLNGPVHVIEAALGPGPGTVELMVCPANSLATCVPEWAHAIRDQIPEEAWQGRITARQTSLDSLIGRYGKPQFIKIDVDGYERQVLAGLSQKVRCLCFEATPSYVQAGIECARDLADRLGFTEFNYLIEDYMELKLPKWIDAEAMVDILKLVPETIHAVDVFAR